MLPLGLIMKSLNHSFAFAAKKHYTRSVRPTVLARKSQAQTTIESIFFQFTLS